MKPSLALAGLLVAAVSARGADPGAAIPPPPVARVALVGVDGLGVRNIPWDAMPNLARLREQQLARIDQLLADMTDQAPRTADADSAAEADQAAPAADAADVPTPDKPTSENTVA